MLTVLVLVGAILLAYMLHSRALQAAERARQAEADRLYLFTIRRLEATLNKYKENNNDSPR